LQGQLELLEVVTDEDGFVNYNVSVSDKVVQFKEELKGKFLRDADWSAYDHIFTSASVIDSWTDGLLSGSVFYPLGAYGRDDDNQDFTVYPPLGYVNNDLGSSSVPLNLRQFLPAVKLKDALDVIFDQVGFRYTGSFTETDDFNNLYMLTKSNDEFGANVPSASAVFSATETSSIIVQPFPERPYVTASIELSDPKDAYNNLTYEYTAPTAGQHIFNCSVEFENSAITFPDSFSSLVQLRIFSGSAKPGEAFASELLEYDASDPFELSVSVTGEVDLSINDKFFAEILFIAFSDPGDPTPELTVTKQNFVLYVSSCGL